jgi:hypothetical protein
MEFRLEFTPKEFVTKINHADNIFLAGSCFTEQIGMKLSHVKFNTIQNPNGILFNPVSLANSILNYIEPKIYQPADLFFHNELWGSWDHHTKFSSVSQNDCLEKINASQIQAHQFLKKSNWLLLTLGSSFVYELENKDVAANCHKVPTDKFNKRLLSVDEIKKSLTVMIEKLITFNPGIKIIFTISPVRHLRDGFIENNRSKANLIAAVHELIQTFSNSFYFPAYELIIDDLRDYRFYAEDMVHPNYAATNYVWNKFIKTCIDDPSQLLMKEINIINAARNHKSFNPTTEQHKAFLKTNFEKTYCLQKDFPYLNLEDELNYFNNEK